MSVNKAIIFDFDGTLVHTVPDVALALNHTLQSFKLLPISEFKILELMGQGAKFMLDKAFRYQNRILQTEELDLALQIYLAFYQTNPIVKTTLYPDVRETLFKLKQSGFRMGICTNKPSLIARIIINKLQLEQFFPAIMCGDEVTSPKPNKQHIFDVLTILQAIPAQSVMVGDSSIDELSAKNAGIPFIGVSYGYGLDEFTSKILINHFRELPSILSQEILS